MKSLLQFLLLTGLVLVGKNVKDQQRLAAAAPKQPIVQPQTATMQSFFVQQVSYKPASAQTVSIEYGRKTSPVSLN